MDNGISGRDLSFIWLILLAQLMRLFGQASIDFIRRWILLQRRAEVKARLFGSRCKALHGVFADTWSKDVIAETFP